MKMDSLTKMKSPLRQTQQIPTQMHSYLDGIEQTGSDPKDSNSTPDGLMAYYSFEEFDGETLIDGGLRETMRL